MASSLLVHSFAFNNTDVGFTRKNVLIDLFLCTFRKNHLLLLGVLPDFAVETGHAALVTQANTVAASRPMISWFNKIKN